MWQCVTVISHGMSTCVSSSSSLHVYLCVVIVIIITCLPVCRHHHHHYMSTCVSSSSSSLHVYFCVVIIIITCLPVCHHHHYHHVKVNSLAYSECVAGGWIVWYEARSVWVDLASVCLWMPILMELCVFPGWTWCACSNQVWHWNFRASRNQGKTFALLICILLHTACNITEYFIQLYVILLSINTVRNVRLI